LGTTNRDKGFRPGQRSTTVSHFTGVHLINERKKQPEKNAGHLGGVRISQKKKPKPLILQSCLVSLVCLISFTSRAKQIQVKIYEQIAGVTSVPKGFDVPAQVNPTVELYYDKFDEDVFDHLPDFIKDKMKGSVEYQAMKQPSTRHMIGEPEKIGADDDLPF
jgi:hypothetical protein